MLATDSIAIKWPIIRSLSIRADCVRVCCFCLCHFLTYHAAQIVLNGHTGLMRCRL